MNSLPSDLLTHVLEYLDFHNVLECSLVSRAFYNAVNDDFLWVGPIQEMLPCEEHSFMRRDRSTSKI
jgi:hypothetical protein